MLTIEEARTILALMRAGVRTLDGDAMDNAMASYLHLRSRLDAMITAAKNAPPADDTEGATKAPEAA